MEKQEIRTFGRRHGKKLSARQTMLIDRVLPTISPTNLPANTGKILEIGFGAGEHLREIARQHQPNAQLSKLLWTSQEREQMIISTMLQPINETSKEEVYERMKLVQNPELAEQISFNLLRHLPYAEQLATELVDSNTPWYILTGLLLIPRICQQFTITQKNIFENKIQPFLSAENNIIKNAANNSLLHLEETTI